MRKEIPEPNSKTTVIMATVARLRAAEISLAVGRKTGKSPSLALVVHHLIMTADAKETVRELAMEVES